MEKGSCNEWENVFITRRSSCTSICLMTNNRNKQFGKRKDKFRKFHMFPPLILQRDKNVTKTIDIRRMISRRLQLWKDGKFKELISEAEQCNKKLPKSQFKMTDEKAISIFTRLLLNGKIREAVRFITERQESGGVMMPHEDALKPAGKTVLEVLELKHPDQTEPMQMCLWNVMSSQYY